MNNNQFNLIEYDKRNCTAYSLNLFRSRNVYMLLNNI